MKYMKTENSNITDYSNPGHWLSLPANPSNPVDIFYVYPTSWHKVDPAEPLALYFPDEPWGLGVYQQFELQSVNIKCRGFCYLFKNF
jgi:hypothetical protein